MGNKKMLLLMVVFILLVALMGWTLGRNGSTVPERFVKDTVSWVQGLLYRPAGAVAAFFEDIHQIRTVYQENEVLRQTLAHYARDTMRLNELEEENRNLKELLQFTERQMQPDNKKYRIANVVSASPDPHSYVVTIDLGAKDGIKPNMAVISVDGLLGRIHRVSDFYSTVQLLTEIDDTNNDSKPISATVKGKESDSFGIVEQYDPQKQMLVMSKIPQTDPIAVGDTVITSGLGRVFPSGIVIGTVAAIETGDFGITYKAYIQPAASFRNLRTVMVVEVPEL